MKWAHSGATSITFCRSHESVRWESATSGLLLDIGLPPRPQAASDKLGELRCGLFPSGNGHLSVRNNRLIQHSCNMLLGMPSFVKGFFDFPAWGSDHASDVALVQPQVEVARRGHGKKGLFVRAENVIHRF